MMAATMGAYGTIVSSVAKVAYAAEVDKTKAAAETLLVRAERLGLAPQAATLREIIGSLALAQSDPQKYGPLVLPDAQKQLATLDQGITETEIERARASGTPVAAPVNPAIAEPLRPMPTAPAPVIAPPDSMRLVPVTDPEAQATTGGFRWGWAAAAVGVGFLWWRLARK